LGKWYKVPTGIGAGVMGLGYWCFATNVALTIFQSRLVKVPKPQWHLWKFFATGAAALTVGTVQGVIQVQPANADWLYKAGHAGDWIDPISHAHINLVTGLAMLVAGALFALVGSAGGVEPSRRVVNRCFYALRGARAWHAAGTDSGVPGRQRAARPRRRRRRRDRQPARPAEHARRADGAPDRPRLRCAARRRSRAAAATGAVRRRRGRGGRGR